LAPASYSLGEEAAVNYAHSKGVVLVGAAGNTGARARPEQLHYPAAHPNVMAVSSTQADDNLSWFSTRGDFVDVAAPGSSIYSTYFDGAYGYMSGTSMATPHVSALAALILSRNPTLTPDQVRAAIERTVDDLGPQGRDIYYGHGRINARRALEAVSAVDGPPSTRPPGPGLDLDLAGCAELIENGGFEAGLSGWQAQGSVGLDAKIGAMSAASARFAGGVSARGVLSQSVGIPDRAVAGLLKFNYRIDPSDTGGGTSPDWPFDDWFTAEWRDSTGAALGQLLRTGNTADTVSGGLEWDEYLYRLDGQDLAALRARDAVSLVFTSQNDADADATHVWVDNVRLCVKLLPPPQAYLPLLISGR
jgi:hypothetical protein